MEGKDDIPQPSCSCGECCSTPMESLNAVNSEHSRMEPGSDTSKVKDEPVPVCRKESRCNASSSEAEAEMVFRGVKTEVWCNIVKSGPENSGVQIELLNNSGNKCESVSSVSSGSIMESLNSRMKTDSVNRGVKTQSVNSGVKTLPVNIGEKTQPFDYVVKAEHLHCGVKIELVTSEADIDDDSESQPTNFNYVIKTEAHDTAEICDVIKTEAHDTAEICDVIKAEPLTKNTSDVIRTEVVSPSSVEDAQTEEGRMAALTVTCDTDMTPVACNIVRPEPAASSDEDWHELESDRSGQECCEPPPSSLCQPSGSDQTPGVRDVSRKTVTSATNLTGKPSGQKSFACDVCGKSFGRASHLKRHKLIHTNKRPFACDVCGKTFQTPSHLKKHKQIHTGHKPFVCDVCSKSFGRADSLKAHKMIHTGQKPFACDVCNYSCIQSGDLKMHKRIHTGHKPFACDVCGKMFSWPISLKTHKLNHSSHKPFACDVCGKTFSRPNSLKTHKLNHSSHKPFACDVCGKTFSWPNSLKAHKVIHSSQNPFVCDVCGKIFIRAGHLNTHKLTHTDQKPFACDV